MPVPVAPAGREAKEVLKHVSFTESDGFRSIEIMKKYADAVPGME
jgi:hypothetical protein